MGHFQNLFCSYEQAQMHIHPPLRKVTFSLLQGKRFWRECCVVDIVSASVDVELLNSNHPHKIIAFDMIALVCF